MVVIEEVDTDTSEEKNVGGVDNKYGYKACPATGRTEGVCAVTLKAVYGIAALRKQQGNDLFAKGHFEEAAGKYSEACKLVPTDHVYFLNRSKAYLKALQYEASLKDAEEAAVLSNNSVKSVWQLANIFNIMNRKKDACIVIDEFWKTNDRTIKENHPLVTLEEQIRDATKSSVDGSTANKRIKNAMSKNFGAAIAGNDDRDSTCAPILKESNVEKATSEKESNDIINKSKKEEKPKSDEQIIKESVAGRDKLIEDCIKLLKDGMPQVPAKGAPEPKKPKPRKKAQNWENVYTEQQKGSLVIKGGHQYMEKPNNVKLPEDYKKPVGILNAKELGKYNCKNKRLLISILGSIFDVSDRPDKYGENGPYFEIAGRDISWGLYSGCDDPTISNSFYDFFKHDESHVENMMGVCAWIIHFTQEYGEPVGNMYEYRDRGYHLPKPPEVDREALKAQCVVQ